MSGSPAFEWLCSELQQRTNLTQVQARGTVRLMLSEAGLDPNHLRKNQLLVLIERQLLTELKKRRIIHLDILAGELAARLRMTALDESQQPTDPETVFSRLGRK